MLTVHTVKRRQYARAESIATIALVAALMQRHGLTGVEARLAVLLTDGLDLRHAASVMCITENTARTAAKRCFCKTNTHTQAQLVSLTFKLLLEHLEHGTSDSEKHNPDHRAPGGQSVGGRAGPEAAH